MTICPERGASDSGSRSHDFPALECGNTTFGAGGRITVAAQMLQHAARRTRAGGRGELRLVEELEKHPATPNRARRLVRRGRHKSRRTFKIRSRADKPFYNDLSWSRIDEHARGEPERAEREDTADWAHETTLVGQHMLMERHDS